MSIMLYSISLDQSSYRTSVALIHVIQNFRSPVYLVILRQQLGERVPVILLELLLGFAPRQVRVAHQVRQKRVEMLREWGTVCESSIQRGTLNYSQTIKSHH